MGGGALVVGNNQQCTFSYLCFGRLSTRWDTRARAYFLGIELWDGALVVGTINSVLSHNYSWKALNQAGHSGESYFLMPLFTSSLGT